MEIWNTIAIALGLRVEDKKIQPAEVAETAKQMANSKPGEPIETTSMSKSQIETALKMVYEARDRFHHWREAFISEKPYYIQHTFTRIKEGHAYYERDRRLKSIQYLEENGIISLNEKGKFVLSAPLYEIEQFQIWQGIDPTTPTWAGINNVSRNPYDLTDLIQFRLENSPGKQYRIRGYIGTPPLARPID